MPENPAFGGFCDWFDCTDGCFVGRGGGGGLPRFDVEDDVDAAAGFVVVVDDGFETCAGAGAAADGWLHALFTSFISQLFVE